LLELMIAVRTRPRFTVDEMAAEFAVSRRTMLRDLHALSEMGVPLAATPGPGGGYSLIANARMPPLSLTVDEAIGIVISYESFVQYADTPFSEQSLSAITKLRNAMPADVVRQLNAIHACVSIFGPQRSYRAPHLADLVRAALDRTHMRITYVSRARETERLIFPIGLYASDGFWYLVCHDYMREHILALRADRVRGLERVDGREPPTDVTLRSYLEHWHQGAPDMVPLRASISRRAAFSFDFQTLFGDVPLSEEERATLDTEIPHSQVEWYADHLLALGTDIVVESPPELIDVIRRRAEAIAQMYS
jgi:predicted DNA-binding transcriptional regulator YafY